MNRFHLLSSAALLVLGFSFAAQASYTGEVFDKDTRKTKLFDFKLTSTEDGNNYSYNAQFVGTDGNLAIEEKASLNGLQIVRVDIDQKQTGAKATIEFDGKTAKFSKTEAGGKPNTSEETVKGDFVSSSNFQRYVASKWSELSAGKTINFRYAVWDRMETVGFSLKKLGEEGEGDAKLIKLQMKPSSFFIAALVKPIEFKFKADGSKLMEMVGRVAPKQKDGSKWKDLDAVVLYKY